jgi:hypothetical protein
MRISLFAALAVCAGSIALTNVLNAIKTSESTWIARLQATPVSAIEPGLPEKPFGDWFGEHTHGVQLRYVIEACGPSVNPESLKKGSFSCVTATATRGLGSQITVKFLVVLDQDKQTSSKQPACKFTVGSEGPPPGSPIKAPTRVFRTLSEMAEFLGWQ